MPCYVYVLCSKSKEVCTTYVGWTTNLEKRLDKHNNGTGARSTRGRQWRLLYVEQYYDRSEAMSREYAIKHDRNFRKLLRNNC